MASISVPCPKCSVVAPNGAWNPISRSNMSPSASLLNPGTSFATGSARFPSSQNHSSGQFPKLRAQYQKIAVESSSNSSSLASTKSEILPAKNKDDSKEKSSGQDGVTESTISAFMAEVSSLVKLVDSKDITELHLKKEGCELTIRKKEALPHPPVPAPIMMPYAQHMFPSQPAAPNVIPPAPVNPVPAPPKNALPPPKNPGSKSSLPPLKCPMAGTFYRCPAPGEPPFVKVGDKVQKGQVVCIIEAMKLMNEIEADKSGTVVEILAEDGKPVSLDTPLLVIQP
ncbi:biotin carboxyl carrier protein of acetyl-CoA carboxylase 1, chloroplastic [Canna indica]|uniref:Biotin carboxyl carrier protein of acetyl-CoA carboxylase n=1 Tax=Canna indica TaxID=4628 RepID=A0AAQ3KYC5_9LILI|nr:biotin carboxyl carrier protein of acetyl-CoA carboxylase 1, chloroplastic [Canna indica]